MTVLKKWKELWCLSKCWQVVSYRSLGYESDSLSNRSFHWEDDRINWSPWGLKLCLCGTLFFFFFLTSYPEEIDCLKASGIPLDWKSVAARRVDLGYRFWRACLHSLADVITFYQRGISECPVMTLLLVSLGLGVTLQLTDSELDPEQVLKNCTAVSFMIEKERKNVSSLLRSMAAPFLCSSCSNGSYFPLSYRSLKSRNDLN